MNFNTCYYYTQAGGILQNWCNLLQTMIHKYFTITWGGGRIVPISTSIFLCNFGSVSWLHAHTSYHWDILQYSTTLLCAATFVDDVPLLAATRIPTSTKSFQKMSIDVNHRIETWEWSHVAKCGPVEDGSLWIGCLQMPYSQVERYLLVSKTISYIYYSFKIVAAKYEHSRVRSE